MSRSALSLVRAILAEQRQGSDYDALYFGMQDVEDILEATVRTSLRPTPKVVKTKRKRAPSAYNKKYAAAFKKVAPKFKKKNGGWVKDGFKRAGAAARKAIK